MFGRILFACVLGFGAFAADAVSADTADGLYDALLKATPTALPPGVGAAQTAPVSTDGDDQSAGVRGILQVTFQSKDPLAKVNYVVLADAARANAYVQRYVDLIGTSGARQIMLPYLPQANCAASAPGPKVICGMAVDRVVIFSFGSESAGTNTTGPTSLAGPLIKAALDHLTRVKTASGKT
jgi:hypothetical protein